MNVYNVHPWGDDFAQYIKEALNIANGKPYYQSGYIYNPYNTDYAPPQYPPGYPLLLAPVARICGISYLAFAYFNTCITVCLLFALFAFFSKHTGKVAAICLATLIVYSAYIIYLKANVLSDTTCLLFVVLYLYVRSSEHFSWQRVILLMALAAFAMLVRTQAVLLLVTEGLYFPAVLIQNTVKKEKIKAKGLLTHPSLLITVGGLLLYVFADRVLFYAPLHTTVFYDQFIGKALGRPLIWCAKENMGELLSQFTQFFHYDSYSIFSKIAVQFIQSAAPVFIVIGFIVSVKKRLAVDDIFFVLMCLLVLYLPMHDVRYFLPALPLMYLYCYHTLKIIVPAITGIDIRYVAIIITVLCLKVGYQHLSRTVGYIPDGCIPSQKDITAFSYITTNVKDDEIIAFSKPRLLTLYTNKRSINIAPEIPASRNKAVFDSLKVKYILTVDGMEDKYFKIYLGETQRPIASINIAPGYTLYTIR